MTDLREQIDEIDSELVKLLLRRFDVTDEVGFYKKENNIDIDNESRELEILNKIEEKDIIEIYKLIFSISKRRQKEIVCKDLD